MDYTRNQITINREYEVKYDDDSDPSGVATVKGELIDLDEKGFVVIDTKKGRVVIRKDRVRVMSEVEEEDRSSK